MSSWIDDRYTLSAQDAEVRGASDWLVAACRRQAVPQSQIDRLEICLNEILANIIAHGGSAARLAPVVLRVKISHEEECSMASVTVSDAGTPFNPLSAPEKILPEMLADAAVGGLGLVMIRRCAEWLDYRHEDGRNHLTFGARWSLR